MEEENERKSTKLQKCNILVLKSADCTYFLSIPFRTFTYERGAYLFDRTYFLLQLFLKLKLFTVFALFA